MQSPIFRVKRHLVSNPPRELLSGQPWLPNADQVEAIDDPLGADGGPVSLDHELVDQLFQAAMGRGDANDTSDNYALDRWLAPRLHAAVRIPRRVAADNRFWSWMSMRFGATYVHQRFAETGIVRGWRYTGEPLRNGVARLWWASELLRNGPDYSTVDKALRRVRTAQFALELRYSWYRPAAIAFVDVVEDDGLSDSAMNALSRRSNAYLPLAPLEAIGFEEGNVGVDEQWWSSSCTLEDLTSSSPPQGPKDGYAGFEATAAIARWYREVLAEEQKAQ